MKITGTKNKIEEVKDYPGLIELKLEHEIKETKATCRYVGPFIPKQVWDEVLSFFDWTFTNHHSESQVRLYVNRARQTWGAWAFPQKIRTGMTAVEFTAADLQRPTIETEEMMKARFAHWDSEPSGDWIYWGTAHHHNDFTAFQSGVDRSNEQNQVGLHITVGNMGSKQYTFHARFYVNGAEFDPDMSYFWDIGAWPKIQLPRDLHDRIARHQMTIPVERGKFPAEWMDNVHEVKAAVTHMGDGGGTFRVGFDTARGGGDGFTGAGNVQYWPLYKRTVACIAEIIQDCVDANISVDQLEEVVKFVDKDEVYDLISTNLYKYNLDWGDLMREWLFPEPLRRAYKAAEDAQAKTELEAEKQALLEDKKEAEAIQREEQITREKLRAEQARLQGGDVTGYESIGDMMD